jgi:hypothetical protein
MHKHAPFSHKEIQALDLYQTCGMFHPYTCPRCSNSILVPMISGLICQECHTVQTQVFNWTCSLEDVQQCITNLRDSPIGKFITC